MSALIYLDLEAYDYIDKYLSKNGYFAPINAADLIFKNTLPFDAALYLHLSEAKVVTNFGNPDKLALTPGEVAIYRVALADWIGADDRARVVYEKYLYSDEFNVQPFYGEMKRLNIRYMYSGAHSAWARLVPIERLEADGCLTLIYHKNGARIYEVDFDEI